MSSTVQKKYSVVVNGVTEVTLVGTADFTFWYDRLRPEGLYPFVRDGRVELTISATSSKWMAISFQELAIAVSVCREEGCDQADGQFLVQAFNSRRSFVFIERTFFRTPYDAAEIQLKSDPPLSITLSDGKVDFLVAKMAEPTPRLSGSDEDWQGPIYLPGVAGKTRLFYARLSGYTDRYAFQSDMDRILIDSSPRHSIFEWLKASKFDGFEWLVRRNATHARSRTQKMQERGNVL